MSINFPDPMPDPSFDEHATHEADQVTVYVTCGDSKYAGTKSEIAIEIFGQHYTTGQVPLRGNSFEPKKISGFIFDLRTTENGKSADTDLMPTDPGPPLAVKLINRGDDAIVVNDIVLKYRFKDHNPNDQYYRFICDNAVLGAKGDFGIAGDRKAMVSYYGSGTNAPSRSGTRKISQKYDSKGQFWRNDTDSPIEYSETITDSVTREQFEAAVSSISTTNSVSVSASAEAGFGGFGASVDATVEEDQTKASERIKEDAVGQSLENEMSFAIEVGAGKCAFLVADIYMDLTGASYAISGHRTIEFFSMQDGSLQGKSSWIYEADTQALLRSLITDPDHLALFDTIAPS
ncbi:PLAT/LH2 domain-containing protein [uncultured Tateyamaria sp.]|uniref:PLAT/LH2 domain-containing protein n=1 Tax=uncultured Tateyamaria sp. TaxID=455651 RepID=UPI0026089E21|nr:PLAT/LH2 domain-containing protein [uncultured Tateyamaria sp.]